VHPAGGGADHHLQLPVAVHIADARTLPSEKPLRELGYMLMDHDQCEIASAMTGIDMLKHEQSSQQPIFDEQTCARDRCCSGAQGRVPGR